MSDAGRLVGFGLVLAAALGVGFGVGSAVGPLGTGTNQVVVENPEHPGMEMGTAQ